MIVYKHIRLDTNEIFYIGIGKTKKRAYSKHSRNSHWKNIVNKAGYSVEIVCTCEDWNEACNIERYLIKYYGRCDLGTGTLVNLTDGGDGTLGYEPWNKGKKLPEYSGENHPMYGKKHTKESKLKISKTRVEKGIAEGSNNPMYGKKHTQAVKDLSSKKVIDITTGIIYNSAKEVSDLFNIKYSTLKSKLNGAIKTNNTNFKYLNND